MKAEELAKACREFQLQFLPRPWDDHPPRYAGFEALKLGLSQIVPRDLSQDSELGFQILRVIEILVQENNKGRRPWVDEWESYFKKCMEDAAVLLRRFSAIPNASVLYRPGFCNQFVDLFLLMEKHHDEYADAFPQWSAHFGKLATLAAELFALSADSCAKIVEDALETPDDAAFTFLLTGFSKSEDPKRDQLLREFEQDSEAWVRELARSLSGRG